jgi:endoglucanase
MSYLLHIKKVEYRGIALSFGMPVPTLNNLLKRILKQPTAPFHEQHVRAEITELLKDCPHVKLKKDKFGNLHATYKHGRKKSSPTWVLCAHMDHPAFVRNPTATSSSDEWEFLGGINDKTMADGLKRKLRKAVKGADFATWNLPLKITAEKIEAPACDDLVNCATIIATFWELARLNKETTVHAVFTRAEEVGWLGAWELGETWPFGEHDVFLSLETSRPVNGAVFGAGPVVRVGDKVSVFDSEAISAIMRTAKDQGIRVQRCLLDAGACEATALQALGFRAAGISVPLGNYHNTDEQKKLAAEYVMTDDVKELIKLLVALVVDQHGDASLAIHEKVALRFADHAKHIKATEKTMK